jgi:hypothetical protein
MADVPVIISKSIRLREGAAPSNPVNIGTPQEPLNPDGGGGVVPHNELAGLQGGTATERYHIEEDQYDAVNGANNPSSTNVFATIADVISGSVRDDDAVHYDASDNKNDTEKAQARDNISVYSILEINNITGDLTDLNTSDKDNLVVGINQANSWKIIEW